VKTPNARLGEPSKSAGVFIARRPPHRSGCFTPALIEFGGARHEVVVSDLTERGARVACTRRLDVADVVTLVIFARLLRRRARVAWRQGLALGLEFIEGD
jgi:hypothetical protein